MNRSLGLTIVLYALLLALICTYAAVTGRTRPRSAGVGLVVLEIATAGQALLDGLSLIRGDHRGDTATNLGYLAVSLLVLPIAAGSVRLDPRRWGSAALSVGCVLLAVVTLRLHQTLGSPRV